MDWRGLGVDGVGNGRGFGGGIITFHSAQWEVKFVGVAKPEEGVPANVKE